MKRNIIFMIAGAMLWLSVVSMAQPGGMGRGHQGCPGGSGLSGRPGMQHQMLPAEWTQEQRQAVRELVQELRSEGASRDEIRAAVGDLLQSWGFSPSGEQPPQGRWMAQMSEEQRQEVQALIRELRDQGATCDEIHEQVASLVEPWGIEMPESPHRGLRPDLSEDQKQQVRELVQSLKEEGASREEIRRKVHAVLDEWGIELPDHPRSGRWSELSEAQRTELRQLVQSLREQGKSREEIQAEVKALFESWGMDVPRRPLRPGKKRGLNPQWDLTPEQRATLRETVQSMRQEGATCQEIRKAVQEWLQKWGIEDNSGQEEQSSLIQEEVPLTAKSYPNPFNPSTQIRFTLQEASPVQVDIYNIQGQLIRSLLDEYRSEGMHTVTWDGRDQSGARVSSGTYIYKVTAAEHTITEQMTLTK